MATKKKRKKKLTISNNNKGMGRKKTLKMALIKRGKERFVSTHLLPHFLEKGQKKVKIMREKKGGYGHQRSAGNFT